MAVVSGCMPEERDTMIRSLAEDRSLTEVTLGNKLWLYEAWLAGGESNLSLVLQDIDRTFGKMACQSSTLYETSDGADDFELAGSLCHGWSAVACYIYNTFARGKV